MRLRVRLAGAAGGETHRVVTPEVCNLAALRTLVASRLGMPPASVRLSLNGTDELAPGAAGGATLQAVGIAPGDLLYVLPPAAQGAAAAAAVQATAADAAAAPALAPLTWQQPARGAAATAHATQPARPAQPAQPSAEARRAACLRALEARGAAGGAAPAADSAAVSSSNAASTAPPATDDDAMDTALTASDALTPSASVPDALREVLASCAWSAPSDALALLLHAAMLESGFRAAAEAGGGAPGAPPAGWRAAPGRFAFRYIFAPPSGGGGAPAPEAWLRCRAVGGALVAYGGLEGAPAVHRLELPLASGAVAALASPRAAWAAAKDALASRLLAAACEAAGAPPPPALTALPDALKRLLLAALPAEALAAVAATCRDLRYASADEDLWRRLYERQFGQPDAPGAAAGAAALAARRGWRAAFAAAAMERARQTRRDAMAADMRRRRPRPHIFPAVPSPPPGFPGAFPGIIGGDYDLHPGGGFGHGGFGGPDFGGGGFGFGLMQPHGGPMGRGAMGGLPQPHHFSDEDGLA